MCKLSKIAKFEIVSMSQWAKDVESPYSEDYYYQIKKPMRSTERSAGYDFVAPYDFTIMPGASLLVYTGIRADMVDGWVLTLHVRSSMGIKHGISLANTTGIVDADFFHADNEGHIMLKLVNDGCLPWEVNAGDRICQGIFVPFGITVDDEASGKRTGGVGSTGK